MGSRCGRTTQLLGRSDHRLDGQTDVWWGRTLPQTGGPRHYLAPLSVVWPAWPRPRRLYLACRSRAAGDHGEGGVLRTG